MVDGSNAAQSISDEIFNNTRSVTESHIRLRPFTEVIIREFVQWTRDTIRLDNDPVSVYFKVNKRNNLIGIWNTHKRWKNDASNIANNKTPKSSTEKMRFLLTTQFIIDENVSQMSNVTRAIESIMGGRNEQAFLRSCNDLQTWNVLSKQITREANEVSE